ncbi:hypothetical protein SAMN02745704_01180 [Paucidesulfovibrio gracilis DSM 16080]|uniref:Uncharacterized protein n=1 Tax=Paucidesulfovibrio gracilis DSM 16080 TaxID=1121449 RepID=A0A1T4WMW1_9BACT|nr:hypothetical protein [Paucidesulfovibrio gracilis]SKA78700.1 hypothetical protein SAMN02745704_01180 [Paucidesulfovibrio gracilis DSM 16080]
MRTYCIEDIPREHADIIAKTLDQRGWKGPIEGIWYVPISEALLEQEQQEHLDSCGPYMMALERIDRPECSDFKLELLVRARNRMRCSCVAYASPAAREWAINLIDEIFQAQDVPA